jgi:hypothetical protein
MTALQVWQTLDRRSGEWRWCLLWNRWAAQRALVRFFGIVSRLGDGAFWYVLIATLALFGGGHGRIAGRAGRGRFARTTKSSPMSRHSTSSAFRPATRCTRSVSA